ncbi:hypothetical protein BSKO_06700 [Bryopsis sp. KO-2023]|nr:hypothetical protein BSKO_06700 [Bryopsis sp. KO-2023]
MLRTMAVQRASKVFWALAASTLLLSLGVESGWIGSRPLPVTYPSYEMTRNLNSMNRTLWGQFRPPLPTNAWWGNLVNEAGMEVRGYQSLQTLCEVTVAYGIARSLSPPEIVNTSGSMPLFRQNNDLAEWCPQILAPLPYLLRPSTQGLVICYPNEVAAHNFVSRHFAEDLQIESKDPIVHRHILHHDELTVSMRWQSSVNNYNSHVKALLARGSPYVTTEFKNVRPLISSRFQRTSPIQKRITGTKFKIVLNNGQTWIIYTSSSITLTFRKGFDKVESTEPFTGVMRMALLLHPSHEKVLDQNSDMYTTKSDVHLNYNGNKGVIKFSMTTASMSRKNRGNLLTLALPHHIQSRIRGKRVLEESYDTIKGRMTGIIGKTWYFFEELPPVSWRSPRGMDGDKIPEIKRALQRDQFKVPVSIDLYQFAKQLAGLGRCALIADELNEHETARNIRERMKEHIEPWYEGTNAHRLLYDVDWGGIVTWQSIQDRMQDFGSAMYNDHHFQYGYMTYAAAVIAKEDKAWFNRRKDKVLELVRDYANPNRDDSFYPYARHFDFYMGHSWAGGLWVFGASKNQESSSEAVNSYYAIHLLGEAMGNNEISQWGRMLMAMEIRSTKMYWHITSKSKIYPQPFARNKVVGILWSTRVDYSTWFGLNVEFIHCIQYQPFTPITEYLLGKDWMAEAYPVLSMALSRAEPKLSEWWKGYIVMAHAIFAKDAAWGELRALQEFDLGNSATNAMYWIATRPSTGSKRLTIPALPQPTQGKPQLEKKVGHASLTITPQDAKKFENRRV